MIIEVSPTIINICETRVAAADVLEKLNITWHYAFASPQFLTIELSDDDAVIFFLANGGHLIYKQVKENWWST